MPQERHALAGPTRGFPSRCKQLEQEGKFLVDQVEDGVVAPGRTKRNAPKVVTEEQLMAIASQPMKRSKKAAKQAEPSQSSKPITSFLKKKPLASFVCFPYRCKARFIS